MEKFKPHHHLPTVKRLVGEGKVEIRQVALVGAAALGMGVQDILDAIGALQMADFYKSMTAYGDHQCWHDVYRPKTEAGSVYLKLTMLDDVIIVSFKEQ
jgi:motility quorum-sensing regulator/GCU-specific mRNA interferase toxin